ncbi:aminotransferase, partial [Candidatus Bathyarchaeota archaeon]
IDICVTGSQKCLACPPGLALVSVSEEAWKAIEENSNRPFYFDLVRAREFWSDRHETPFTPALPLFYALDEALIMLREEGLEARIRRHAKCARAFYSALEGLGLRAFPKPAYRSNTVIAVRVPDGLDPGALRTVMRRDYGVLVAGGMGELRDKIIRIGCMGVISAGEVIRTVAALGNALNELGHEADVGEALGAVRRELEGLA